MFDLFPKALTKSEYHDAMVAERNAILRTPALAIPPNTLWHYTDSGGLKGIVESGKLRATHLAYLNDASEYIHAVTLALEFIRSEKARGANMHRAGILDQLENFLDNPRPQMVAPIFVTCFSTAMNSLNQWRAYGKGEGGYAIGFETKRLMNLFLPNAFLTPVEYDRNRQILIVERMFGWGLNEYDRLCQIDASLLAPSGRDLWWSWFLIYAAAGIAPVLKNPAFSEEAEWRFIHLATNYNDVEFIPRHTGLRPIIDVNFTQMMKPDDPRPLLPITDLWSGPGSLTDVSLMAGRGLLEKNGYRGVNLHLSKIPFRVG